MNEPAQNQMVDVLRGSSAVAVALFHFSEPYAPLPDVYHRTLKWGWLGVAVFFVISGFCIAAARPKTGLTTFWFRRLARIFPPYWMSVVLVLFVVGLRIATTGTNDVIRLPTADMGGFFYTLAALTSPASAVHGINLVYWSLGYELAFYILVGVLAFRATGTGLIVFSVVAFFCPGYPFDQWGLFGLGVACYHYNQRQYRTAVVLGVVCLASVFFRLGAPQMVAGLITALLVAFPPACILSRILSPLRQAGLFSYSLYLIHVPIGCYLLQRYLPWMDDRRFWPSVRNDFILLTACVLFAYLFYRLVEKPSHEFARGVKFDARAKPIA